MWNRLLREETGSAGIELTVILGCLFAAGAACCFGGAAEFQRVLTGMYQF